VRIRVPAEGERIPVPYLMQTLTDVRPRNSIVFEEAPSSREPNASVAQVLPCHEVPHRLEQQLKE